MEETTAFDWAKAVDDWEMQGGAPERKTQCVSEAERVWPDIEEVDMALRAIFEEDAEISVSGGPLSDIAIDPRDRGRAPPHEDEMELEPPPI